MEIHPQILFWPDMQDQFSHAGLHLKFTVHVLMKNISKLNLLNDKT